MSPSIHSSMIVVSLLLAGHASFAWAVSPTAEETAEAQHWVAERFENVRAPNPAPAFFSFIYDSKPSREFLTTWAVTNSSRALDQQ